MPSSTPLGMHSVAHDTGKLRAFVLLANDALSQTPMMTLGIPKILRLFRVRLNLHFAVGCVRALGFLADGSDVWLAVAELRLWRWANASSGRRSWSSGAS